MPVRLPAARAAELLLLGLLLGLLLALAPAPAAARPFTVEDLLAQEAFGAAAVDPAGRWLVVERRDAHATAPRFDLDHFTPLTVSRLMVAPLDGDGPARPLLTPEAHAGHSLAGFSPAGTRLAVQRLDGEGWTLGVITLATGQVRWLGVTPELSVDGRTVQWRSEDELLVIDRPDGSLPVLMRLGRLSAERLPGLWARAAGGRLAVTILGSGAFAGVRARPPPRRLLRIDVRSGRRTVLATGELVDLETAPGGRSVALLEAGEDLPLHGDEPLQGDRGLGTQAMRLTLLDLQTGIRTAPCPACDLLPHLLAWSPDGRELLAYARPTGAPWPRGELVRIAAASGAVTRPGGGLVPVAQGRPTLVPAGWMGADPVVLARPAEAPSSRPDWYRLAAAGPVNLTSSLPAAPRSLTALGPAGLVAVVDGVAWRIDPAGRAARLPLADVRPVAAPRPLTGDRLRTVIPPAGLATASVDGERRLVRLAPDGVRTGAVLPPDAMLLAAGPDASAAFRRTAPGHVQGFDSLELARPDRPPRILARLNPRFADVDPPRAVPVAHAGPDGSPLTSWLFLPPPAPGAPPPPLVVRAYAGETLRARPTDPPEPRGLATDLRVLTGHGYAVLVPSLPTPQPRGEPAAGLADRILTIVDAAAADPATAGAFDAGRIALWGKSFGGYTALAAVAQTDRFRAAVVISAPVDLLSKWGTIPPMYRAWPEEGLWTAWSAGWVETAQGDMGVPPWTDLPRYARNSPLWSADRIRTPILLMHGDQDNIPITQAEAMFSALHRQDRDALLVTYWGERHHIVSPGNVRDLYARAFGFLDARLGPPEPCDRAGRSPQPERWGNSETSCGQEAPTGGRGNGGSPSRARKERSPSSGCGRNRALARRGADTGEKNQKRL
ncbi:prolyl oligopeptidase family serine peptidase [Phenylobacterium sp.]|uniref:prolyl oligopeptidase family serine peptidase n=1 Tax=Phenylobacterium sp. TaxID=1871053 RepID=UPI002CCA55B1|nr:prolyl oligopeptidase family serine peptidase [Phenylobacterium sp.]HVI33752.1 prolyl oligopeptidase family serine peptidase [Phenylobacterium sp.]